MSFVQDREEAIKLFMEYNSSESLLRHALAVEAVMKHFAALFGEDAQKWGIIGILHDIDYERYPEQHCAKAREILTQEGYPEEFIRAVQSHGYGIVSDIEPVHIMEKTLYAVDELTGLIAAAALMRPSKSILDLGTSSVKKKWKQKGFAAGVNREVIEDGAKMLGMTIDELIAHTIDGMKAVAADIGLGGETAE